MRQRNTSGSPLVIPAIPAEVPAGGEINLGPTFAHLVTRSSGHLFATDNEEIDRMVYRMGQYPGRYSLFAPRMSPEEKRKVERPVWTVLNSNFREQMPIDRTVRPNEPIIRLGAKDGEWELEMKIPQKHVGQVLSAFAALKTNELDVDILLVSPTGQKVMLMSDVGGGFGLNNVTLTLSDRAAAALPATGQIVSGTYLPTDVQPGDVFPAPAPAGPYATALSAFNGQSPNGAWSSPPTTTSTRRW